MSDEILSLPEDITSLSAADIDSFESKAIARFRALNASTSQELATQVAEADEMAALAAGIERVRLERARREEAAVQAGTKRDDAKKKMKQFGLVDGEKPVEEPAAEESPAPPAESTDEPTTAGARPRGGATTEPQRPSNSFRNPSLADAQRRAPSVLTKRENPVLVASADVPNHAPGQQLEDMDALVAAMQARARTMPVTRMGDRAPRGHVASLQRDHKFKLGWDSTPEQINEVLVAATNPDILVAAGGWCAPSEISYDFYNVVCSDGRYDIPTVGINRGGIRWPISPSFADVVLGGALWTWTEAQDIAAVTGTAQSGVKTCGRVPCVTFDEERLRCDGICLTVGNLTEDAYPELIANHTRLVMAAHDHKMNRLYIDAVRALSAGFTVTNGTAGEGVVAPVLGALELQAIDYRARYAMCEDALIEVVGPRWLRGMMRSDLRKRTGASTDQLSYSDAQLMRLFDAIGVRIQWVDDYQIRTGTFPGVPDTLPTAWPTTVEFLMYAPGTVVLGQGLRLDLGVIRDSVLNETNDYTAEWMEECWLVFQPGHEVRRLTVNVCPDGTTGAHDIILCGV